MTVVSRTNSKNKKSSKRSVRRLISTSAAKFAYPLVVIVLALTVLSVAASIYTTRDLTANANVLGEDDQSVEQKQEEEQQKEAEKQAEEAQKESAKQAEEQQKESDKTAQTDARDSSGTSKSSTKSKTETISPDGLKVKMEVEDAKQETEIETADGQKIKTKVGDDGLTKIEIENGAVKLKYIIVNGQMILKAENEDGEEVDVADEDLAELENELGDELEEDDIRLVPTADHQLALTQYQIAALTDFPILVNSQTRELIVTTPDGQRVVTVLPGEAVQNLLATGIINSMDTPPTGITVQDQLDTVTGVVDLIEREGEIVYKIKGRKTHRILGLIPLTTPVTAFVSIDSGLPVAKEQSVLTDVIDFLSP
ncbi:MAG: hypothetical protein UZ21_OP11001000269 [Microgenomates bacterium OLB22]|nr:MAG: hypothetical protein UZ21_OP11001000269 [Microgenomates bacterium OLB22]